jgi:Zn-dependent protease
MTETFRLGRIGGVRVGVNWSVLVVFALIAYGLAGQRFPAAYPGQGLAAYVTAGLLTAVVFFASLLAHELAHALVARRNGVSVEGITLWLFGGVAKLQGEADDPAAELRIAGVGPLVSLALGVLFGGLVMLLRPIVGAVGAGGGGGAAGLVLGALFWLAAINVALAAFNVIPAAPLDGGRLLRALWWRLSGDRVTATRRATQAGQVFGWALIILGLWGFLVGQAFGALWLALIGWFLLGAATMEGRQAAVSSRLAGVRVGAIMTPAPATVPADMPVADFLAEVLPRHRHSSFPVLGHAPPGATGSGQAPGETAPRAGATETAPGETAPGETAPGETAPGEGPGEGTPGRPVADGAQPRGLVTLDQIRQVPQAQRASTPVGAIACPLEDVARATPDEQVVDLLPRLTAKTGRRALVVEDGRLVGIVSPRDVSREIERRELTVPGRGPGWG